MMILEKKRVLAKQKLINECKHCNGKECNVCLGQGRLIDKMGDANIPVGYWFLKLADFQGPQNVQKAAIEYIKSIEDNYGSGRGLIFTGNFGTGKTTAVCSVLKSALIKGYSAYYTTLNDLIHYFSDFETKSEFFGIVTKSDFLCIDEVDSRHFSDSEVAQRMFGSTFERVVRHRKQNQLPVLIATNNSTIEEVFTGQYRRAVDSLLKSSIVVPALGKDYRIVSSNEKKG